MGTPPLSVRPVSRQGGVEGQVTGLILRQAQDERRWVLLNKTKPFVLSLSKYRLLVTSLDFAPQIGKKTSYKKTTALEIILRHAFAKCQNRRQSCQLGVNLAQIDAIEPAGKRLLDRRTLKNIMRTLCDSLLLSLLYLRPQ